MAAAHERDGFRKRLDEALRKRGRHPASPTRLAEDVGRVMGRKVTAQAVRKWLDGDSLPTVEKFRALEELLQLPPFWLQYGNDGPARGTAAQPTQAYRVSLSDRELVKRYRLLDDRQQQAIAEIITALSGKG